MADSAPSRPRNGSVVPITAPSADESALHTRPTTSDLHGENYYAQVARKHWLGTAKTPRVRNSVVKEELWDHLEKDDFAFGSLLILENLQLLEQYLWPGYSEESSNHHVLLMALLVTVKRRENLPAWDVFTNRASEFSSCFRRILSMTIDSSLSSKIRQHLISFIIGAFQSLDSGLIRKECAPLVSIGLWHNLHSDSAREGHLDKNVMLRKAWRAMQKKYDGADDETKGKLRFERSWLYTLLLDFLNRIYGPEQTGQPGMENRLYCERFLEFLSDLLSQLPTRRYVNTLLQDLHLVPAVKLSPMYSGPDSGLFRDLFGLFRHFTYFPIDDQIGQQQTAIEYHQAHCAKLARLQRIAIKHFNKKLHILALSNYASLDKRADLEGHLKTLIDDDIQELCQLLKFRTEFPSSSLVVQDRDFFTEVLVCAHERRPTFQESVREMHLLPTERVLYEETFLRNQTYNGSRPLAIPKLNLQYLSMGDFLWRSFILYRAEAFYEIRSDMEDAIKRMEPKRTLSAGTRFNGFSRLALPIPKPAIVDVAPANVGQMYPAHVRSELILDVSRLNFGLRKEWELLRHGDVIFLLAVHPDGDGRLVSNGHGTDSSAEKIGLKTLRAAEVVEVQDENGKTLRENQVQNGASYRRQQVRLIVNIDAVTYQQDIDRQAAGKPNVYEDINMVVRRRGRENNFRPILESIRRLTLSDIPAPTWFQEVFLGYGDPASATYKRLSNRLKSIDFRDTFLDWQHLIESLPGKTIEPSDEVEASFGPPYVLEFPEEEQQSIPVRPSKKRRRAEPEEPKAPAAENLQVTTYKPPNTGPYPTDAPKLNAVRFTPAQIQAITSGTQPGLTVIVGPPGTGKTDVATQIINNIYHNFPSQRTLLVAHSNQALNQLFQKIVALDIDERHLLRLGHGEEELETEASFSKFGRVESFLENGAKYLAEVNRLAQNFQAPGAHGSSCETADYFNKVYVQPAWTKYWEGVQSGTFSLEQIISEFPFHQYFSNAPQPLFSRDSSREAIIDVVTGCYRHVEKIFSELEDIRPFEILRNARDKANYLLIKEARIIAMTSTHAAMRRQEIAKLGFHYDNVIMEEAAQITEIENFIPLALQDPKDGELPLQRIVMCGDHYQNSPIIQNMAFRQYANLEQSLFLRLQGRARPTLADLYQWRYPHLGNLPSVETSPEYLAANAGFRYDYQFIDVPDYKGKGESEPTPHFIQNLGEAEYAVQIYMYMRLLGYAASKISILTTYAGQRALIKDVLDHRCKNHRLFGLPRIVTTVDKYQGEQNDYIILSLVRTTRVGYLRDIRRLTVALSRARLGLYVLGRRAVFESCLELHEAFDRLFARPTKLAVVTGEMHPTKRLAADAVEATDIEGLEHLGNYVVDITKATVEAMKANGGVLPAITEERMPVDDDEDDVGKGLLEGEPVGVGHDEDDVHMDADLVRLANRTRIEAEEAAGSLDD
ncbi:P-loop containing nucleoside triphosphate hydrolase protein [Pseudovirgaria hyperparasitica]|uniref:Pre-mRNA-splicing factor n=1 Tax=Pseudovirgaria hyperparasitica TaxID=470096 RepID=A0A6A6WGN1_9PEZI|nr:P-loop containing nucleoside triphosphate hydrolase protein [Pseudovirgaria hyperparasitica]KAF2761210.1 P-loop containing nucleoside triphosphate hydrolase protein [Pseudovirgaria hyperparasitica]